MTVMDVGTDGAAAELPDVADIADVDAELNDVAGHLNVQHARLVDVVVRVLAEDAWTGQGFVTLDAWLAWRTGVSTGVAGRIVMVAERSSELPECMQAFRAGLLSFDQMAAIAKRAPWWTDEQTCRLSQQLTVRQIQRMLAEYPFPDIPAPWEVAADSADDSSDGSSEPSEPSEAVEATDASESDATDAAPSETAPSDSVNPPGEPPTAVPDDTCWFGTGDDGRFRMHLECDQATGELIESALSEARDRLFRDGQTDVDWVDALRDVTERSLDAIDTPGRRDRHRIHVHVDTGGDATEALGWTIPDEMRRQLLCDGLATLVEVRNGVPISVGRSRYLVPERTRRIVVHRDHGCRVPGCRNHRLLEIHHVIHWLDDGPTDTWNLVALCPRHHRMHHRRQLGITGNADDPDGLTFTDAAGREMSPSGARPTPPGAPPSPLEERYRHPLGERLDTRWLEFAVPPEYRPRPLGRPHSPN